MENSSQPFEQLKNFLEKSPACSEALKPLKKGVEIAGLLDKETDFAICNDKGVISVEQRKAGKHDVIFHVDQAAVEKLVACDDNSIAEIAVATLKEVKSGQVRISVPGNLFSLMKNGYLEIIAKGGKPMWKYLSDHGITSPKKIIGIFKDMIKQSK